MDHTTLTPAVLAFRTYDAFGNILGGTDTHLGPFGYGGGFRCQEDETGLKLLGHRLYDSSTGRFLTRDPIKDGRNWYVYCENDPVGLADPDGQLPFLIVVAALVVAAVFVKIIVDKVSANREHWARIETEIKLRDMWRDYLDGIPTPPVGSNVDRTQVYHEYRAKSENNGVPVGAAAGATVLGLEVYNTLKGSPGRP